jgi:hypothetical protein
MYGGKSHFSCRFRCMQRVVARTCAIRDLASSVLNGLPPSVSLDEITTVWPFPLSEFEEVSDVCRSKMHSPDTS